MKIVNYSEEKQYVEQITELYEYYNKMPTNDRKNIFDWLVADFNNNWCCRIQDYVKCFEVFMNLVFQIKNAQEYKWINDYKIKIHCFISVENYEENFNIEELRQYAYENESDLKKELSSYATNEDILRILQLIYSKKHYLQWWKLLCCTSDTSKLTDEIKDLIIKDKMYDRVFEEFDNKLYTYKLSYNDKRSTNTFNYCNLNDYKNEIRTMLYLIKDKKVLSEKTENLLKRCKKILKDYSEDNNFKWMCEFLEEDKELLKWIINS